MGLVNRVTNSKQLSQGEIRQLITAIDNSGFFSLNDDYGADFLDPQITKTSIRLDGNIKTIAGVKFDKPQQLIDLEQKIVEISGTANWIECIHENHVYSLVESGCITPLCSSGCVVQPFCLCLLTLKRSVGEVELQI